MYALTIFAIIIGTLLSKYLSIKLLTIMGSSTDLMYIGKASTKLIASITTLIISILLNTIIAKSIDKIDLVKELKSKD
ncbi:hypothetical protein HMPREF1872_01010 [Amygdalobacter nucleatus]|uniref:Uncharacterized protein n=2 Tax=Amygdalobacter nucleatus TaxID=3029274 RepID=A0A133YAF9_9FIRM|nr:hypothetical protein HMPREF1872_01010 [Amygdalobacter nucleatus]